MGGVLVVGGGFLGGAVLAAAGPGASLASRSGGAGVDVRVDVRVDIRDVEAVDAVVERIAPDIIINCAAATDVDLLEGDPAYARAVNALGAGNVARAAQRYSARLVHVSTDSVFDGEGEWYTESDAPRPVNEYARSKLEGEEEAMSAAPGCAVARANMYGRRPGGGSLLDWIEGRLRRGEEVTGFADIVFNPLEVGNLAAALLELARTGHRGIMHLGCGRALSKYEFAREAASALGYDPALVRRGASGGGRAAKRPRNTTLDCSLARSVLKTGLADVREGLAVCGAGGPR
ncbi:MAG: SDR family oxidoreductase [Nitrosopumilus sp.]|nr:SDR family oxidoreductase [Nitrosopumilus sp.]MDA7943107.1 SDR family oxidoreductase [Nitrosopumilus sp.]